MPNLLQKGKSIFYQNVKPTIDKMLTNPTAMGLVAGVPGLVTSYLYKPDFDARQYKTQDEAYSAARKTGAKTFIWNGGHYNTDYKGNPNKTLVQQKQEELDTYGITNEQTQNKNILNDRLINNVFPANYTDILNRTFNAVVLNKPEIGSYNHKDPIEDKIKFSKPTVFEKISDVSDWAKENLSGHVRNINRYTGTWNLYENDKIRLLKDSKNNPQKYKIPDNNTSLVSMYRYMGGYPQKDKNISIGNYKPTINTGIDNEYYYTTGEAKKAIDDDSSYKVKNREQSSTYRPYFGEHTVGVTDKYRSFYDKYDINPYGHGNDKPLYRLGKPLNIYDRKYFKK